MSPKIKDKKKQERNRKRTERQNTKNKKRHGNLKQTKHEKRCKKALDRRAERETYYMQQEIRKVQTKNTQIINSPQQDSE